jgi:DNA-directed RNA polymerase subunit RPC12/RpoP
MLVGHGLIKKKSVKYLGDGKFELIITEVEPSDISELLAFSGQYVNFQLGKTIKSGDSFKDQPESGRLFTADGNGVVQKVEGVTGEQPKKATIYVCDNCGLHLGALGDDGDDTCPECDGKLVPVEVNVEEEPQEAPENATEDDTQEPAPGNVQKDDAGNPDEDNSDPSEMPEAV